MIKVNRLLLASLMLGTTGFAETEKRTDAKVDDGTLHGYVRLHHIFDGEANGFDKNTGSTLGVGFKYEETVGNHLAIGGEFYGVIDTGFQNEYKSLALGQGLGESKSDPDQGHVSGLHFTLKNLPAKSKVTWARSPFKSPMTKIEITHVPNMYEYLRADTGLLTGNLSLSYITEIAYGSRSAADFSLIGEQTATAGMVLSPFRESATSLKRGEYYRIADTTTGTASSSGIAVLGYARKFGNLNLNVWNFNANNVLNNFYTDIEYKVTFTKGKALILSAQYLDQKIEDTSLHKGGNDYGGGLYGLQASLNLDKLVLKVAYNEKDDEGGFYNAWGANPGYTSSIFSRNEYRDGVKAQKLMASYNLTKSLQVIGSYARYGQSEMKFLGNNAQSNASERDIVLLYKPQKNLMLKLFNVDRTSEFNGLGNSPKTQNQTRLIVNYDF